MTTEENKAVYQRFIGEVFNKGNFDVLDEVLAPSYMIQDAPLGSPAGAEAVKQVVTMFRTGFPDLEIKIEDLIAEDDKVAARSTLTGTHRGAIFGIAPTGKSISMPSLTMVRIVDGRLVWSSVKNDTATLMRQLGAEPPPPR